MGVKLNGPGRVLLDGLAELGLDVPPEDDELVARVRHLDYCRHDSMFQSRGCVQGCVNGGNLSCVCCVTRFTLHVTRYKRYTRYKRHTRHTLPVVRCPFTPLRGKRLHVYTLNAWPIPVGARKQTNTEPDMSKRIHED